MKQPLIVTNFNKNFTGVSATAANVIRTQIGRYDLHLVGHPLPGCPAPVTLRQARKLSRNGALWHVRRNTEMRAAIWARDVLRLPIKIAFTSAAIRRHSAFPRWLISRMDAVIATTEQAAAFVPNVRGVVPHGVDTSLFHPADHRVEAWSETGFGGSTGIATIGRIRPEKGTDAFVATMLKVLPENPGAVAVVVGKATREHQNFLTDLKAQIELAGLTDRILFPGEIPATDMPAVLRGLSLIVQLPGYEGYGMAPLEGMASAVPFVGYDTGYYRAFSAQHTTGHIVMSPEEAAQACQTILSGQVEKMGAKARDIACTHFSIQSEADGIDAVYQTLL